MLGKMSAKDVLFNAAVAGAGASFGRDVYKKGKKNSQEGTVFLIAVIAVLLGPALTFYAGKELSKWHDRSRTAHVFLTVIWNSCIALLGLYIIVVLLTNQPEGTTWDVWQRIHSNPKGIFVVFAGSLALGLLWGLMKRPSGRRKALAQKHNEAFLKENGIYMTGMDDIPYKDSRGNYLSLIKVENNRMLFMVKGKKLHRAVIQLDESGKMTRYSIIKMG